MSKAKPLALIAILILSAIAYLYGIIHVGVFYWDQAFYCIETKVAGRLLAGVPLEQIRPQLGNIFPSGVAKPTFIFLMTLLSGLFKEDGAITILTAFCGWMTIPAVYWLVKKTKDAEAGLWSAAFLALSPLYLLFSRHGFPNIPATLFFVLGTMLYLQKKHFWSGFLIAVGYSCHYALLPMMMALHLAVTFFRWREGTPLRQIIADVSKWVAGFVILPIFWEIVYQIIPHLVGPNLSQWRFHSYLVYIFQQFTGSVALRNMATNWLPLYFPLLFLKGQGIGYLAVFVGATVFGVYVICKRKFSNEIQLAVLLGAGFTACWVLNPGLVVARVSSFFIPFQCVLLGISVSLLPKNWLKVLVFLIAVLPALPTYKKVFTFTAGYGSAAALIPKDETTKVIPFDNDRQWEYYLGHQKIYRWEKTFSAEQLNEAIKNREVRYLVTDYGHLINPLPDPEMNWLKKTEDGHQPVATVANPMGCDSLAIFDRWYHGTKSTPPDACLIKIYDLWQS